MLQPHFSATAGKQAAEHNVIFIANFDLDVLEFVVVSDGEVRRQRPRRRRPDEHKGVRLADDGKLHINALADVILVFDFGLGQRGAAGDAPINRLFAAINKAFLHDVGEQAQFVGLVFLVQREIGIFPIAQHAEAFELRALDINVFAGVGFAGLADGGGIGARVAGLAHFLGNLEFDGQTVAIPAGNVRRAEAAQGLVFDDDVLENLVQRGADVDIAVGKGRAVVQDEFFRARRGRPGFSRKASRLPTFSAVPAPGRRGRPSSGSRCAADSMCFCSPS